MVAALTFVLLTQTTSGVRTSLELWQGSRPPEGLRATDQWLCYNTSNPNSVLTKLAQVSKNSPEAAGKPPTLAQINRWLAQVPAATPSEQTLKIFLKNLDPKLWPTTAPGSIKWFRCRGETSSGVTDQDRQRFIDFARIARKTNGQDAATVYLRVRKCEEHLLVSWVKFDAEGKYIGEARNTVFDFQAEADQPGESINLGIPEKLNKDDLTADQLPETPSDKLPVAEIAQIGLAEFVHKRVRFTPGTLALFRESHWIKLIRTGGSISGFLNSLGYRKYQVEGKTVILPPFVSRHDERNLALKELSPIPDGNAAAILRRYKNWFSTTQIKSFNDTSDLIGSLAHIQYGTPGITEIYPFWNVMREAVFPVSEQTKKIEVLGSPLGTAADQDLTSLLVSSSVQTLGPICHPGFNHEQGVGYNFSPLGSDHVKAITCRSQFETRYFFPESRVLAPLDAQGFAGNFIVLVNEANINQTKLQVVRGLAISFTVHTLSGQENKVKAYIEKFKKAEELEDAIFEVLLPTEVVSEVKNGKKSTKVRKLYPGYVFIQMVLYGEDKKVINKPWYFVKEVAGVIGFVGGERPAALQPSEIVEIRSRIEAANGKEVPKVQYTVGEEVKITDGAFASLTGRIDEIDPDRGKLKVSVSIFGRFTPVELEYWQVQRNSE